MSARGRRFPAGMLATGRIVHRLLLAGLPMGPLYLLQTRGRRTGELREVPVAVLRVEGEQWLISPFGDVGWVHNVRASGEAHLRRGAQVRRLHVAEVKGCRDCSGPTGGASARSRSCVQPSGHLRARERRRPRPEASPSSGSRQRR